MHRNFGLGFSAPFFGVLKKSKLISEYIFRLSNLQYNMNFWITDKKERKKEIERERDR